VTLSLKELILAEKYWEKGPKTFSILKKEKYCKGLNPRILWIVNKA
jgi:hypothetical protein